MNRVVKNHDNLSQSETRSRLKALFAAARPCQALLASRSNVMEGLSPLVCFLLLLTTCFLSAQSGFVARFRANPYPGSYELPLGALKLNKPTDLIATVNSVLILFADGHATGINVNDDWLKTQSNVVSAAFNLSWGIALVKTDGSIVVSTRILQPPSHLLNAKDVAISNERLIVVAISANGSPVVWGSYSDLLLDPPPEATLLTDVEVGSSHIIARKFDGTVICWGANDSGQCMVPRNLSDVVNVGAYQNVSFAITSKGKVHVWGGDLSLQKVPSGALSGVVKVSATRRRGFILSALKADGTLVVWGSDAAEVDAMQQSIGKLRGIQHISDGGTTVIGEGPFAGNIVLAIDPRNENDVVVGSNITLSNSVASMIPFSVQWLFDGLPVPNATNTFLTLSNISYTNQGNYRFIATGSNTFSSMSSNYKLKAYAGNDNFNDARRLPATGGEFFDFPSVQVSRELGEPYHAGGFGGSLWYRWTAPADALVQIEAGSVAGAIYDWASDIGVAVYEGNALSDLVLLATDADGGGPRRNDAMLHFASVRGRTYHIAVAADGPSIFKDQGWYLRLRCDSPTLLPATRNVQGITFTLLALPSSTQVIEASEDLWKWAPLATNLLPASGIITFEAPLLPPAPPMRFFRLGTMP